MGGPWNFYQGPKQVFDTNLFTDLNVTICFDNKDDIFNQKILNSFIMFILDANYKQGDIAKLDANQEYLTQSQWHDLHNVVSKYNKNFDGSLGSQN